jgi:O-antigen/teichoic acid export membrane protein
LIVLFASEIVYIIAPPEYYGAMSVVVILSAGATTQIFGRYTSVQYAYTKKPFWIFPTTVVGTLFNVGVNILLIPRYGLVGAAFATVASTTIVNILLTLIGQKLYRIKYEWGIIAMLMGTVVLTMLFMLSSTSYNLSLYVVYSIKMIFISIFILLGIRAGIITKHSVRKGYNAFFRYRNGKGARI